MGLENSNTVRKDPHQIQYFLPGASGSNHDILHMWNHFSRQKVEMDNAHKVQDSYLCTSSMVFKGLYLLCPIVELSRWGIDGMAGLQTALSMLTDIGHKILEGLVGWGRASQLIGRHSMAIFGGILMECKGWGNIWNVRWWWWWQNLLIDSFMTRFSYVGLWTNKWNGYLDSRKC